MDAVVRTDIAELFQSLDGRDRYLERLENWAHWRRHKILDQRRDRLERDRVWRKALTKQYSRNNSFWRALERKVQSRLADEKRARAAREAR